MTFSFSPSKLYRIAECPGSLRLSDGIPDEVGPAAEEGRMLHERVATGNLDGLAVDQADAVKSCIDLRRSLAPDDQWLSEQRGDLVIGPRVIGHGVIDALLLQPDGSAVVIDWKFGRADTPAAEENIQVAAYALMVRAEHGVKSVDTVLFQPRVSQTPSRHTFREFDSIQAHLQRIVERAEGQELIMKAGEHCRYCPANKTCSVLNKDATSLVHRRGSEITKPDEMAVALDRATTARLLAQKLYDWSDSVRWHASCMIRDGQEIPGYTMSRGKQTREVEDINAAYGRVVAKWPDLKPEKFVQCCKLSLPTLERQIGLLLDGQVSRKDAKALLATLLADLIKIKDGRAMIVKSGASEDGESDFEKKDQD